MCFSSGGGGSSSVSNNNNAAAEAAARQAAEARAAEERRQANIRAGVNNVNNAFGQFNDQFYADKSQNYLNYYLPQVEKQYNEARQNTLFQLARQGLTDSSAGAKVFADLATDYGNQRQSIQSGANNYVQQAKAAVEAQRNSLINQATATADPTAAANAATNAVGSLQMIQPTGGYSPLTGLFSTFSGALGNTASNALYGNTSGGLVGQIFKGGNGGSSQRIVSTN